MKITTTHKVSLDKAQLLAALRLAGLRDIPDEADISINTGEGYAATVSAEYPLVVTWGDEKEVGQ